MVQAKVSTIPPYQGLIILLLRHATSITIKFFSVNYLEHVIEAVLVCACVSNTEKFRCLYSSSPKEYIISP